MTKPTKPWYYGGQAVMDGVMMRGRHSMAVAVRAPDGTIALWEEPLQPGPVLRSVRGIPFVRGAIVLWDTLLLGMRALIFSANVGLQEEEVQAKAEGREAEGPTSFTGPLLWLTVAMSLAFSIGLFFVAPLVVVDILERWIEQHWLVNLIEGLLRLGLLVGYMYLISLTPDIRRVFQYHGAEHMTINAYERKLPVDVANVRQQSLTHVRCGTGFMLIVVLLSILVFIAIGRPAWYYLYASRILLVPFIAAIAYEIIRVGASHSSNPIVKMILAPGLALQGITTRRPDDDMLEVAIAAFEHVLVTDAVIADAERSMSVVRVTPDGKPVSDASGGLLPSAAS